MDGFYSVWSKPYLKNKKTKTYSMRDFELLTLILSVCVWQRYNGKALLIADKPALDYFQGKGLLSLFEGGVSELKVDDDIDTTVYWAGGKLYALKAIDRPMCMVDLDLIVWKSMEEYAKDADILVIHREEITDEIYPDPLAFEYKDGYELSGDLDKSVLPCNTAMLYFNDIDFIHEYANEAIRFMKGTAPSSDNLNRMVFAEQRMISMMAAKRGKNIKSIFPLASDIGLQDMFTHLWGHKNVLKYNYEERVRFCKKVINRLRYEYPAAYDLIVNSQDFKAYL